MFNHIEFRLGRPMSWLTRASCAGQRRWLDKPIEQQLADCDRCPVAHDCLLYAIDTRSTNVVMGGIEIGDQPVKSAT